MDNEHCNDECVNVKEEPENCVVMCGGQQTGLGQSLETNLNEESWKTEIREESLETDIEEKPVGIDIKEESINYDVICDEQGDLQQQDGGGGPKMLHEQRSKGVKRKLHAPPSGDDSVIQISDEEEETGSSATDRKPWRKKKHKLKTANPSAMPSEDRAQPTSKALDVGDKVLGHSQRNSSAMKVEANSSSSIKYTIIKCLKLVSLLSSDGYIYNATNSKTPRGIVVTWSCQKRFPPHHCPVKLRNMDGKYVFNGRHHNHSPDFNRICKYRLRAKLRKLALENPFQSTTEIVNMALGKTSFLECKRNGYSINYLKTYCSKYQQKARQSEKFFRKHLKVRENHHLIFATEQQLELLALAKMWYIDVISVKVTKPFIQLLSISSFARSKDKNLKHPPLCFVVMSNKTEKDYEKVFRALLKMLPSEHRVREFVTNSETEIWKGLDLVFEAPSIRVCVFQWSCELWRKVEEVGLHTAYSKQYKIFKFLRDLFALPFIPAEHIPSVFNRIYEIGKGKESLGIIVEDIHTNMIDNCSLPASSWSVFGRSLRMEDDVRGWQKDLIKMEKSECLQLHILIGILHKEAKQISSCLKMLSEGKLLGYQQQASGGPLAKLSKKWDSYLCGDLSGWELLKKCAGIYNFVQKT